MEAKIKTEAKIKIVSRDEDAVRSPKPIVFEISLRRNISAPDRIVYLEYRQEGDTNWLELAMVEIGDGQKSLECRIY